MADSRGLSEVWADVVAGISWDSTFMAAEEEKETGEGMDDRKGSRREKREGGERVKDGIAEQGGAAGGRQTEEGWRAPLLETDYVSGLGGGYTHLDRKRSRCTHCPANKDPRKRSRTDIFDFSQPVSAV